MIVLGKVGLLIINPRRYYIIKWKKGGKGVRGQELYVSESTKRFHYDPAMLLAHFTTSLCISAAFWFEILICNY